MRHVLKAVWVVCAMLWQPFSLAQQCPPPPGALSAEEAQVLLRDARDRGFLWRIEKNGVVGHLYGSMHVSKREWMFAGPRTLAALRSSDAVALEMDVLDPDVQSAMADARRLKGLDIPAVTLPAAQQQRMNALAVRVCAHGDISRLHPMIQLMSVTLLDARFTGLEIQYGNEVMLSGLARGLKKVVISLESVDTQMRALLGGSAADLLENVDRAMALMERGQSRAVMERLGTVWAEGRLDELEGYEKWCECADTAAQRRSLVRFNDQRNPGLAAGIDKIMSGGQSVFAAVGALHMTGPQGLPGRLAQMGYRVERVLFDP